MNETRRKPTTERQSPSLCDKWHGVFHMPSRIDEAGHTNCLWLPSRGALGESRNVQFRRWDSNRQHIGPGRTRYQLSHPGSPRGSRNPGSSTGGIVSVKNSPATRRPSPWGRGGGGAMAGHIKKLLVIILARPWKTAPTLFYFPKSWGENVGKKQWRFYCWKMSLFHIHS